MSRRRRSRARNSRKADRESLHPALDLHGYTADEAERLARRWLRDRRSDGDLTVRIVTGRGRHSVGPPVLIGAIDDLLRRLLGDLVESYERDPAGGAYQIRLSRRLKPNPADPRPPRRLDPELAREAEEILAQLGVHPTPALIESEVERIRRDRGREAG